MQKVKHIDVRYRFVNDMLLRNDVKLININSETSLADFFTEHLDRLLFNKFWDLFEIETISAHDQDEC